jgi:hypothetical protein
MAGAGRDGIGAGSTGRGDGKGWALQAVAQADGGGWGVGHAHRDGERGDRPIPSLLAHADLVLEGVDAADAGADDHTEPLSVDIPVQDGAQLVTAVGGRVREQAGIAEGFVRDGHGELTGSIERAGLAVREPPTGVEARHPPHRFVRDGLQQT